MAIRSRLLERSYSKIPQPMSELNITPLIDVLLVLLVMLILSIPIATHQVEVDLPNGGIRVNETQQIALSLTQAGAVLWNGEQVDRPELEARLARAAADPAEPVIRFDPNANTSYDDAVQVIHLVGEANIDRFAFADTHEHRVFAAD
ncbi:ExbD/TolR family protein [Erythrobacter alti]|uniref:ExbD/TolR family protein n=1 Tax=Erythrobacter alti TaxID=1896145 RepID=UPI0030F3A643